MSHSPYRWFSSTPTSTANQPRPVGLTPILAIQRLISQMRCVISLSRLAAMMLLFTTMVRAQVVQMPHGDPLEFAQIMALRLPKSGRGITQQRNGTNTNDLGEFRLSRLEPGKYLVFVMPQRREMYFGPGAPASDQGEPQPVPTYYPGVAAMDQAQPITVERAATVNGIEIPVMDGVTSQVAGSVIDPSGAPVSRGGGITVRTI